MSWHSIPPTHAFADILAAGILARYGDDPMRLARCTVFLPGRRAVRTLQLAFLKAGGNRAGLPLPRMIALADMETIALPALCAAGRMDALPAPAPPPLWREWTLARLTQAWLRTQPGQAARMEDGLATATSLLTLLDECHREDVSTDAFSSLVEGAFATHWERIAGFLALVLEQWPVVMDAAGFTDPEVRYRTLAHALCALWNETPPPFPVIAAGSTGSIPATAALLHRIAALPEGTVILPGLDTVMPEETWRTLPPHHPQYRLKTLLETCETPREHVTPWREEQQSSLVPHATEARLTFVREIFRPASSLGAWRRLPADVAAAGEEIRRITARDPQHEAEMIALLLRETLETPTRSAALVTPDRELAQRVSALMRRWEITLNDSTGIPLTQTPEGTMLRLLAEAATAPFTATTLLALGKHPLVAAGMAGATLRHAIRAVERQCFRRPRPPASLEALDAALTAHEETLGEHLSVFRAFLSVITDLRTRWQASVAHRQPLPLAALLPALISTAEALAATKETPGASRLWQSDSGRDVHARLRDMEAVARSESLSLPSGEFPGCLASVLHGDVYRPRFGAAERLSILSPIEARLQLCDRVILGGLNEGVWPVETPADPWLNRRLRQTIGLPPPEQRTGLAAHDVYSLLCAPEVICTCAARRGGKPALPSPWLQRLETLTRCTASPVPSSAHPNHVNGAHPLLQWSEYLRSGKPRASAARIPPPSPRPPLHARPLRLSVSDIRTLRAHPYAFYTARILGLRPMQMLDAPPAASDFGTLIHEALYRLSTTDPAHIAPALMELGATLFTVWEIPEEQQRFWRIRLARIAEWIAGEWVQQPATGAVRAEYTVSRTFPAGADDATLHGRIDRAEETHPGVWRFIDFKTGTAPKPAEIKALTPDGMQLPLMAWIAQTHPVGDKSVTPASLEYWQVSGRRDGQTLMAVDDPAALTDIFQRTEALLYGLLAAYRNASTPFPYPPVASATDDYAHLGRVREWFEM